MPKVYIADGDWKLDVINGKVQNFIANFTEVLTTGTNPHIHTLAHFKGGGSSIMLGPDKSISFAGTIDVLRNGKVIWSNVPLKVSIR